ncbi:hypothetical protein [Lentzea sp. NPDC092896]|uniref:hypothetical protein n=1 Tax=Lentzea sp. NPDC092896 TaxID=3364127 RepID=UPI0038094B2B
MADTTIPVPGACQHCGIDKQDHVQRGGRDVGRHGWTAPTTEQIRERMLARRAAQQANRPLETTQPTPPPLIPRNPECSLCGDEVNLEDDYFLCENCDISWPMYDQGYAPGEWTQFGNVRCQEVVQPRLDNTWIRNLAERAERFQCVLDADHVKHKLPHANPDMSHIAKGWR